MVISAFKVLAEPFISTEASPVPAIAPLMVMLPGDRREIGSLKVTSLTMLILPLLLSPPITIKEKPSCILFSSSVVRSNPLVFADSVPPRVISRLAVTGRIVSSPVPLTAPIKLISFPASKLFWPVRFKALPNWSMFAVIEPFRLTGPFRINAAKLLLSPTVLLKLMLPVPE